VTKRNGIRFSISQGGSRLLPCLYRARASIALYDALHDSSPGSEELKFSPAVIATVAETMARFSLICSQYGVPNHQIRLYATEAMRSAKNRTEMLESIWKASGLNVQILSPSAESLFGAMGMRYGLAEVSAICYDLGGGSLEASFVDTGTTSSYAISAARTAHCVPYGAARLAAALNKDGNASPTRKELYSVMKTTFDELQQSFPSLKAQVASPDGVTILCTGGGLRAYGSALMHTDPVQPYPIPDLGGYSVDMTRFSQTEAVLAAIQQGKVFGISKRRVQQFPAIIEIVRAIIRTGPHINKVVFCTGGNREGVLYMMLPPATREVNPLRVYPGGLETMSEADGDVIVSLLSKSLPSTALHTFSSDLLYYIARNIWTHMGSADDSNAARFLHAPISGLISGLPGIDHETRAMIALTLCARWGNDLAPTDRVLFNNLKKLVGADLSFWCEYVGTVARLLALILPAYPAGRDSLERTIL
jgi:retrograde regulation protein 2